MKNLLIKALCAALTLLLVSLACANESQIDIAKTTCKDLLLSDGEEQTHIIVFHHGYLAGLAKQTVVDVDKLSVETMMLKERCLAKPEETLLKAFMSIRKAAGDN